MERIKELEKEKEKLMVEEPKNKRNTWTPNDIVVYETYAEVYLRNNKQKLMGIAKIDVEDIDLIKNFKWCLHKRGYPSTRFDKKSIAMHRILIRKVPKGRVRDHVNRDKLDNRRCNLRIVSIKENASNKERQITRIIYKKNVPITKELGVKK